LGSDVTTQLLGYPRAIYIASGVLAFFAITPGMPMIPFLTLSLSLFVLARVSSQHKKIEKDREISDKTPARTQHDKVEDFLLVDPLEVQIGYGMIPLVEGGPGGDLLDRITNLRRQIAMDTGFVIPPVRIRDNTQLAPNTYVMRIRGTEAGRGDVRPGMLMALTPGEGGQRIEGIPTREPSFGLPAIWIPRERKEQAQQHGYTVIEPAAVVVTHLSEMIKKEGYRLMSREAVQELLDAIKKTHKAVVDELVPGQLGIGQVQKVLQNLLKEGLPIRDMSTILETLADYAPITKDTNFLTETVRVALSKAIAEKYEDEPGRLSALTFDPKLEQMISDGLTSSAKEGTEFALPSVVVSSVIERARNLSQNMLGKGFQPIIVTAPGVRSFLRKLMEAELPNLIVLSTGELPADTTIQPMGRVSLEG
jgi:flagellar biosynthesis protein FlhA